ncbi:MAG: heme o synthase [Candidatus Thalassarchaeaceae archaeon]|jgi:protoheme IX farnesyltransferase|nr:heme o synthase [Candidatus Thalassarchaeaceae archaeon]MDP7003612.1 heme o synthase [Candidatus Thalassarchaeaceae archaeon]
MSPLRPFYELTKPRVVILLQITALCAVLVHDLLDSGLSTRSAETMLIVLVGGYLSAGGANAINMWYDRDIDPKMSRTANRPIPSGDVSANAALVFGIALSVLGVAWFALLANQVAAFWSAFSILYYVFVYSIWLKRSTPQNIVFGGIAGSTPPVIGWAAAVEGLQISTDSAQSMLVSVFDFGSLMPWFMFILIFLWTPPHFWALALYRSKEYEDVGVPMMPNVKGAERTIMEMKVYAVMLVALSVAAPISYGDLNDGDSIYHILGWTTVGLSIWYASTVWRIDLSEQPDHTGRIPSAARSFFVSILYLAMMFVVLVTASFGIEGAFVGALLALVAIARSEARSTS